MERDRQVETIFAGGNYRGATAQERRTKFCKIVDFLVAMLDDGHVRTVVDRAFYETSIRTVAAEEDACLRFDDECFPNERFDVVRFALELIDRVRRIVLHAACTLASVVRNVGKLTSILSSLSIVMAPAPEASTAAA